VENPFQEIEIGKGRKLKDGKELAILSFVILAIATAAIRHYAQKT
jgi:hypothetical protein